MQIHCKERLGRLVQSYSSLKAVKGRLVPRLRQGQAGGDDGGRSHPPLLSHRAPGTWIAVLRIRNPMPFFTYGSGIGRKSRSGSRILIGKQFFVLKSELSKKKCLNRLIFHTFWLVICKVMRIWIKLIPLMRIQILIFIWCRCGFIRIRIQTQQYLHYLGYFSITIERTQGVWGERGLQSST